MANGSTHDILIRRGHMLLVFKSECTPFSMFLEIRPLSHVGAHTIDDRRTVDQDRETCRLREARRKGAWSSQT